MNQIPHTQTNLTMYDGLVQVRKIGEIITILKESWKKKQTLKQFCSPPGKMEYKQKRLGEESYNPNNYIRKFLPSSLEKHTSEGINCLLLFFTSATNSIKIKPSLMPKPEFDLIAPLSLIVGKLSDVNSASNDERKRETLQIKSLNCSTSRKKKKWNDW